MGLDTGVKKAKIIDQESMYWRKANHIHNWFVNNFQDGTDDCRYVYISKYDIGKLKNLLKRCNSVIKSLTGQESETVKIIRDENCEMMNQTVKQYKDISVAKKLLPTVDGFFFGGLGYDEWYLEETIKTRDWLKRTLDETDWDGNEILIYWSSW
jgi:hypothetical protein